MAGTFATASPLPVCVAVHDAVHVYRWQGNLAAALICRLDEGLVISAAFDTVLSYWSTALGADNIST